MNERDPISEWSEAIEKRLEGAAVVLMLLAFVSVLFAPLFDPFIKQLKRRQYVLFADYEARAEADMRKLRPWLWGWALVGWLFVAYCYQHYP